jgi:hypothetical protein
MNAYLRKITKELGLEINPQRIMGQYLCKINNTHLGNTLLVDDTPYKTCLNPHFNAILKIL